MKLRGKQKRYLRAQANHLSPIFSVGKNGLTQAWLEQLDGALDRRELIKVSLQQNTDATVDQAAAFIEENTTIQVVQKIGRVLLLFKQSANEKQRDLSAKVAKI